MRQLNFRVITVYKHGDLEIYLSPVRTDDAAIILYTNWLNNSRINSMLGRAGKVVTYEEQLEWAKSQSGKTSFNIVLSYRYTDDEKMIGNCSIVQLPDNTKHGILGINIGDTSEQKQGYGSLVVKALVKYAFETLNLHTLSLTVDEDNIAAIKCYEKAGFVKQGIMRNRAFYNGEYHNSIYMDITCKEWKEQQKESENQDDTV